MKSLSSIARKAAGVVLGAAVCVGLGVGVANAADGCTPDTSTIAECFTDTNLAAAVAGALTPAQTPDDVFTSADAQTNVLDLSNKNLTTIDGLQAFPQLVSLDLSNNSALSDISVLEGLPLANINLNGTSVTDTSALNPSLVPFPGDNAADPANPNKVTVTLDLQGGTFTDFNGGNAVTGTTSRVVTKGQPLPDFFGIVTKDNSVFTGWAYDAAGTHIYSYDPIDVPTTLYAQWSTAETVTFDSQGGSAVEPAILAEGDPLVEPEAPTRDGYTFKGWTTDKEGKDAYVFGNPVNSSFTLYAQWEQNKADPAKQDAKQDPKQDAKGNNDPASLAQTGAAALPIAFVGVILAIAAGVIFAVVRSKRRS